ncbi:MBL fold metallo-hydrolase, partial [uncultured Rothia sp.]|uniref:MBL fold metallo-hydrolase n=1 Tax=uncultured Rothia sp. TaxID=316088 RepID=UPI0025F7864A
MTTYPEPTLIFENPELTVRAFSVSEMDNSVYLITMRATGEQVLIDPADDAEELYAFTLDALLNDCPQLELADGEERRVRVMEKEEDFNSIRPRAIGLTGILVTHGHWDHIRAIKELDHLTGAVTSAGAADAAAIKEQEDYTVEEELTGGESFDFYPSAEG